MADVDEALKRFEERSGERQEASAKKAAEEARVVGLTDSYLKRTGRTEMNSWRPPAKNR